MIITITRIKKAHMNATRIPINNDGERGKLVEDDKLGIITVVVLSDV